MRGAESRDVSPRRGHFRRSETSSLNLIDGRLAATYLRLRSPAPMRSRFAGQRSRSDGRALLVSSARAGPATVSGGRVSGAERSPSPLGPFDVADILLGALDAQLRLRGHGGTTEHGKGFTMSLRIGGLAATIGASIWSVFFFLMTPGKPFQGGVAILAFAGLLALLVAVTGLSAYQARSHPKLVWTAFAMTAAGTVAMAIGAAAELTPFNAGGWNEAVVVFGGVAAILGSGLFGIATYRNAVLSREAASLLVAGPTIGAAAFIVAALSVDLGYLLILPASFCFLAGWFALGIQAIRLDRRATDLRPT